MLFRSTEQGRYRVEVYDPATGAATSTRFYAGWWDSAPVADTPDKVEVVADKPSYAPGDIAHVHAVRRFFTLFLLIWSSGL